MKKFNNKFLFITFAIVFIVILISIFSINMITKKINNDALNMSETNARNRINNVLSLASSEKENNLEYNNESFLTNILTSNGLVVNGNIVSLDNWNFEIDRENLVVLNNLGATQIIFDNDITNYFTGTTPDGQKIVTAKISVNSNIPLDKIILENDDGTFTTEEINNTSYSKDIDLLLDKKYLITAIAKDGKTKLHPFVESSKGKFDSLITVAKYCIKKDGIYNVTINNESYSIHAYVYENDTTINNQTFGDASDAATNMILVKGKGNLTFTGTTTTYRDTSTAYKGGPKGFFIYCEGTLTNNGIISMSQRGAKCNGQNVYLWKNQNDSYEYVPSTGASGATYCSQSFSNTSEDYYAYRYPYARTGNTPGTAINRMTGGGGSGGIYVKSKGSNTYSGSISSGSGASGTSYSGGSGGGGATMGLSSYRGGAHSGSSSGGSGGGAYSNGFTDTNHTTSQWGSVFASGGAGTPNGGDGSTQFTRR